MTGFSGTMDNYASTRKTGKWIEGGVEAGLMAAKLKTAVLGATGYSGLELTRLLGRHARSEASIAPAG